MQKVYGDKCLFRPTIYKWLKRFNEGREDLNDDKRSGRLRYAVNMNVHKSAHHIPRKASILLAYLQYCHIHGAKLWNRHVKIMVNYGTCLQDACVARNSN